MLSRASYQLINNNRFSLNVAIRNSYCNILESESWGFESPQIIGIYGPAIAARELFTCYSQIFAPMIKSIRCDVVARMCDI